MKEAEDAVADAHGDINKAIRSGQGRTTVTGRWTDAEPPAWPAINEELRRQAGHTATEGEDTE